MPFEMESVEELKERLETELRYSPLDVENPPNPVEPKLDAPYQYVWIKPGEPFPSNEVNPDGKNSISLLTAIGKKWEMDMPNMVLLVHGGHSHPLQLVQERGPNNHVSRVPF